MGLLYFVILFHSICNNSAKYEYHKLEEKQKSLISRILRFEVQLSFYYLLTHLSKEMEIAVNQLAQSNT